jgi:GMP synthase-like glutamine amidotransferase
MKILSNAGVQLTRAPSRTRTTTVLVIQHNETNNPGLVVDTIDAKLRVHRSDLDPILPTLKGVDGLIVMGGPQTSFSDEGFPSRNAEIDLLSEAVEKGIPTLGICLGSQLLALATGGRTYRRDHPEIGFMPVTLTEEGVKDRLFTGVSRTFEPRHKHFDSYEMPPGAVRLASSEACLEQGFRLGDTAWGLQFHFEMAANATDEPERKDAIRNLAPTALRILSNFSSIVRK